MVLIHYSVEFAVVGACRLGRSLPDALRARCTNGELHSVRFLYHVRLPPGDRAHAAMSHYGSEQKVNTSLFTFTFTGLLPWHFVASGDYIGPVFAWAIDPPAE